MGVTATKGGNVFVTCIGMGKSNNIWWEIFKIWLKLVMPNFTILKGDCFPTLSIMPFYIVLYKICTTMTVQSEKGCYKLTSFTHVHTSMGGNQQSIHSNMLNTAVRVMFQL